MAQASATAARQRKLTLAGVVGKQEKWYDKMVTDKSVRLAVFYGVARSFKPGSTAIGPYVSFLGDFRAVNIATGEESASAKMILPGIAEELLAGAVSADGTKEVRFAFEIGAKYVPERNIKVEYTLTPLTKMQDEDAIGELRSLVGAKVPALAAPKDEKKK